MKKTFQIGGMHCASCANLIQKTMLATQGIENIAVNIATNSAKVEYDETHISFENIEKIIEGVGFKVLKNAQKDEKNPYFKKFIFSAFLSLPFAIAMIFDMHEILGENVFFFHLISIVLAFGVVVLCGIDFHMGAFSKLKKWQFNMDSLISLGSGISFLYGIYIFFMGENPHLFLEGASFIVTFILLGKYLETKSKKHAGDAISKLLELQEKNARVLENGKEYYKDIVQVKKGDILVVKSGEKIPLDGIIMKGKGSLNEAMLTGESMPVDKQEGGEVFSGTILLNGSIHIQVNKEVGETALQKIVDMVGEAQTTKAPIEELTDKIAGIFVPIVFVISILTFCVWYFVLFAGFENALLYTVSVIVIACPCALGLATPMAVVVATGRGAQLGIFIREPSVLEQSGKIDVVVFDKTGTLTQGKPEVLATKIYGVEEKMLYKMAYSLASHSNHPLSVAISQKAKMFDEGVFEITEFEEIAGKGLRAKIAGEEVLLGNKKWLLNEGVDVSSLDEIGEIYTHIYLSKQGKVIGIFAIFDAVKPRSSEAINALIKMGISVSMITGDRKETAEFIAQELGITNVVSEVLPHQKMEEIIKLQRSGKKVAFVGDGINDSPAIVQADLGVAMATGADVAIESAGIVILSGDPFKVVEAIRLSKMGARIIKQNLFWAFFYNALMIPLAFSGHLLPFYASLAMSISSVSVVLNSLRIRRWR